jgi:ubiquinone/menaquinone biosynthesis C-methylase UbiE
VTGPAPLSHVKETFEDWSMYETVIQHNYMHHEELVHRLADVALEIAGPLTIVDLGCGDAWLASHAFQEVAIDQYLAVDLSEAAVQRAKRNISTWGSRGSVTCGNLAEFVAALPAESADLILASNSLHHLQAAEKAAILQQCFRVLRASGVLCWIDLVRNQDETRETYLRRLTIEMEHDWTALSLDQRRRAIQHVLQSDYPETEAWMQTHAAQAGFQSGVRFLDDRFFGAWKFLKPLAV